MFLQVSFQAAKRPIVLKSKTLHRMPSFLARQTQKIHFVKGSDETGAISTNAAMKVERTKPLIREQAENSVDVFFRRCDRRSIDGGGNDSYAVLRRFSFFQPIQEGEEFKIDHVPDVFGFQ